MKEIGFKKIHKDALLPFPAVDSIFNIHAVVDVEDFVGQKMDIMTMPTGSMRIVRTGLVPNLPYMHYLEVFPFNKLSVQEGILMMNTPLIINNDSKEEILILLKNISENTVEIKNGEIVAQCRLVEEVYAEVVEEKYKKIEEKK